MVALMPLRRLAQRRVEWLLALALLLPLAQAFAVAHALSHVGTRNEAEAKQALHAKAQCDLCLAAASIGGAAPQAAAPARLAAPIAHCMPAPDAIGRPGGQVFAAYRSRAPPASA